MKIYNYDKITNVYLNESVADKSPLDLDSWIIPAYSTEVQPPIYNENDYTCIFKNDTWVLEPIYTIIKSDETPPIYHKFGELSYIINEELKTKTESYELIPYTEEESIYELITKIEQYYDSIANIKKYDNRFSCIGRAGYPGPYQNEGITFGTWMDSCNEYMYTNITTTNNIPTPNELISELPIPPWSA